VNVVSEGVRRAEPGELCTCGRQAIEVYTGGRFGDTGGCGLPDGGAPVEGACTFCGDVIDHAYYAAAERAAGRDTAAGGGEGPPGGRCPLYRLRLSDPLPKLHPESMRPYDAAIHRRERAEGRLRQELLEVLLAAGADHEAIYTLLADADEQPEQGTLADVVVDIGWGVRQALGRDPHDVTSHHPSAGQEAVAVLVVMLRARLHELDAAPNPLAGLRGAALIERAGGPEAWTETVAHDRPLLITRRVVRRALDPQAPTDIYRPWWP